MASWQRTHTCGELRESHIGQTVVLNGWVNIVRAFPDQVFVDLRDRYGLTQVVFEIEADKEMFAAAGKLRSEWVLSVQGVVAHRLPGKTNPKLATGAIEVKAQALEVLNRCPTPPFEVTELPNQQLANEDLRLAISLPRPAPAQHPAHASDAASPEQGHPRLHRQPGLPGAGDAAPGPEHAGRGPRLPGAEPGVSGQFFALPQSPQLYKQLLMVAGYDKYFQIARCLRDEDLRADRQPEFTQLDVEMSFVEMDDVFGADRGLDGRDLRPLPGRRRSQRRCRACSTPDAMLRYGSDKPDLRYGLEIVDIGDLVPQTEFKVFQDALAGGGKVRGLNVKGAADKFSRKNLDELAAVAAQFKAKGWPGSRSRRTRSIRRSRSSCRNRHRPTSSNGWAPRQAICCCSWLTRKTWSVRPWAPCARTWQPRSSSMTRPSRTSASPGCSISRRSSGTRRRNAGRPTIIRSRRRATRTCLSSKATRAEVRAKAYDLVLNGYEVGGGSIRIHTPDVQPRMFAMLGMSPEQAKHRFGFLLDALAFGAPAARRHRPGPGPLGHAARRHHQHPRRDRLSQEPEGPRPHDRRPRRCRSPSSSRSWGCELSDSVWRYPVQRNPVGIMTRQTNARTEASVTRKRAQRRL